MACAFLADVLMFLDETTITVRSGKGGDGCVCFRREKFVPRGGPNGGNGGNGGSVYLQADPNITTLLDIGRSRHYIAEGGQPGLGSNKAGRRGKDLLVKLPQGTLVREVVGDEEAREGKVLVDLLDSDKRYRVVRGGKGGRGNRSFASALNQVPREAEKGLAGDEKFIHLELKLLADVGLVGLPNAGKSTLLSRISAARPKIAAYPFTTKEPNLGIAELGGYARLVVADIPGLIEGAHEGQGLGIEFLRHIERTRVLLHLVSCEFDDLEQVVRDFNLIERELSGYSEELAGKPRIVVLSKTDLLESEEISGFQQELSGRLGEEVFSISAVTGDGVENLLRASGTLVSDAVAAAAREAE